MPTLHCNIVRFYQKIFRTCRCISSTFLVNRLFTSEKPFPDVFSRRLTTKDVFKLAGPQCRYQRWVIYRNIKGLHWTILRLKTSLRHLELVRHHLYSHTFRKCYFNSAPWYLQFSLRSELFRRTYNMTQDGWKKWMFRSWIWLVLSKWTGVSILLEMEE